MAVDRIFDISGGIQTATNWAIRKPNEVEDAENARFDVEIGSAIRRKGYAKRLDIGTNETAMGFHEAKFDTGPIMFTASDNGTNTIVRAVRPDNSVEVVINDLPRFTKVRFLDHLNEVYVAGITTAGVRIQPHNIRLVANALVVSTTRNLYGAPKAAFVGENSGKLYLLNVEIGGVIYPDRAYESSPPMGAVTYVKGLQNNVTVTEGGVLKRQVQVDSTRYIKSGMAVSIYMAGVNTKIVDLTVDVVNNAKDTFTFASEIQSVSSIDVTNNTLTTANASTLYPVGTPVIVYATTTMPAPLVAGTTYYSTAPSGSTIKLATTPANATAGTAIDLTSAGSGAITMSRSFLFDDNYEVWLNGRRDELSVLWNTDYRTAQTADYLRIPAGTASDTSITAWAKSNNRLQIWTATSMHQWDNANFIPVFEDIGCISHDTVCNSGAWVLWLDANGNVRARDSSSGQDEIISRFVRNRYIDTVPGANLPEASASMFDGNYKINFGQVGEKYLRMVYNFDNNSWWRESHVRNLKYNAVSRISGKDRLYQLSDGLTMYLDEEGDYDDTSTIPFVVNYGRRNQGSAFKKAALGLYVYGENISSATIHIKKAGKNAQWLPLGQLTEPVSRVVIGDKNKMEDRDFEVKISHHAEGSAPKIDGIEFHFNQLEENFG